MSAIALDIIVGIWITPIFARLLVLYWAEQTRRWFRSGEWLRVLPCCYLLTVIWPVSMMVTAAAALIVLFVVRVFHVQVGPFIWRRFLLGMGICSYFLWLHSIPFDEMAQIVAELGACVFLSMGGPRAISKWKRDRCRT